VESLTASKNFGDILIVGLNSDKSIKRLKGEARPIMDIEQRLSVIGALEAVDYVIVFDEDTPERLLATVKPDVYVKGEEYRNKPLAGSEHSKTIEYIKFKTEISTTAIVNKLRNKVYLNNTL
jgi:D-beta-D-heptose 7-phosphate kinase/D-beta-D-heptose 1-phosphate adenosyltransferase